MKTLYAAYGSNLNLRQMAGRCPGAKPAATGLLRDHELVFRGSPDHAVATIEPREGCSVPVLLWRIGQKNELALDRYEGWPYLYGKEQKRIEVDGHAVMAMAYVMTPGQLPGLPSERYYKTIRDGYLDCGFDTAILEQACQRSFELMTLQEQDSQLSMDMWGC